MNTKLVAALSSSAVVVAFVVGVLYWRGLGQTEDTGGELKKPEVNAPPIKAPIQPDAKDAPEPYLFRRAVILAVGIDHYRHIAGVKFAVLDAEEVCATFQNLYGFTPHLLRGEDATKANILAAIDRYGNPKLPDGTPNPHVLGKDDAFVLFFAGHGKVINVDIKPNNPRGREGFLLPFDADVDLHVDKDLTRWKKQAISMRNILDRIDQMSTGHALVIADCCCSGFMTSRGAPIQYRNDIRYMLTEPSRGALAATTALQEARWDEDKKHGIFTAALLSELKNWSAKREPASLKDVFSGIEKEVRDHPKGKDMLPQMNPRFGDGDGQFVFLPKTLRESDVKQFIRTMKENQPTSAAEKHLFAGFLDRAAERANRKTQLADLIEAFEAPDYRFTIDADVRQPYWKEKFNVYQSNAANGDVLAMAALHYCYSRGFGTEKNDDAAMHWAQLAYETGDPAGMHVMARCLLNGIKIDKNEPAAMAMFEIAANLRFPISQYVVGNTLLTKTPAPNKQELAKAEDLLRQAGKNGVASADYALAKQFVVKRIPEGRESEGLALLKSAAERGLPGAHLGLYETFRKQQPGGPRPDLELAKKHLLQAARLGDPFAQQRLAANYYRETEFSSTIDFPKDYKQALYWGSLASQNTEPRSAGLAHCLLAHMYERGHGVEANAEKSKHHFDEGVRLNCPYAQYYLGFRLLVHDSNFQRDYERAFSLAKQSAGQGNANGHYLLGHIYHHWMHPTTAKYGWREPVEFEYHGWSHEILENFLKAYVKGHPHRDIIGYLTAFKKWQRFERERGAAAFTKMGGNNKLPSFVMKRFVEAHPESKDLLDKVLADLPPWPDPKTIKSSDGKIHDRSLVLQDRLLDSDSRDWGLAAPSKTFLVRFTAGKSYLIEMKSGELNSYLRLHDPEGREVAFADPPAATSTARIVWTPKTDGVFRITTVSFGRKTGRFSLSVQEREGQR